ncbi:MAG: hypothetical protein JWN52_8169 [Actinomycetia bacterium]|nr:hypothetical protein [Actinomycetes bacterium]
MRPREEDGGAGLMNLQFTHSWAALTTPDISERETGTRDKGERGAEPNVTGAGDQAPAESRVVRKLQARKATPAA